MSIYNFDYAFKATTTFWSVSKMSKDGSRRGNTAFWIATEFLSRFFDFLV